MFEASGAKSSASEIRTALEECSKVHGELTKEAAMGGCTDNNNFIYTLESEVKLCSVVFRVHAVQCVNQYSNKTIVVR